MDVCIGTIRWQQPTNCLSVFDLVFWVGALRLSTEQKRESNFTYIKKGA